MGVSQHDKDIVHQAEDTCTYSSFFTYAEPYSNGWTYKHAILLGSGVATAVTLVLTFLLITWHMLHWYKPKEQTQIVRVLLFAPVFALFNVFACWFYRDSWILTRFPELYEVFALTAFFYMLVIYVTPEEGSREQYFANLPLPDQTPADAIEEGGSLRWFQMIWITVFQILPTKLLLTLLQWILSAAMCPLKFDLSHSSTAISVVQSIVTTACVVAIIRFERRMKHTFVGKRVLAKLIVFKGVVGIQIIQTPIFTGLAEHEIFKATKNVSIFDFTIGTPAFMTCVEMCIVSVAFFWAFSASEYRSMGPAHVMSIPRAWFNVLNITDILKGSLYFIRLLTGGLGYPLMATGVAGKMEAASPSYDASHQSSQSQGPHHGQHHGGQPQQYQQQQSMQQGQYYPQQNAQQQPYYQP